MEALKKDYFEFFSLPRRFGIDEQRLQDAHRRVQSGMHPDRFAGASETERRYAVQLTAQANEAFRVLRAPVSRAAYLCELAGIPVSAETHTAMPPDFLMQQMEWREALEEARAGGDPSALKGLSEDVASETLRLVDELLDAIDVRDDMVRAAGLVRRLMFLDKFASELDGARRRLQTVG